MQRFIGSTFSNTLIEGGEGERVTYTEDGWGVISLLINTKYNMRATEDPQKNDEFILCFANRNSVILFRSYSP